MARWVSIWGQAHTDLRGVQPNYRDRTCLLTVRSALGGEGLRLRLSDREGRRPLTVAAATVSVNGGEPVRARFDGAEGLQLQPGMEAYSDPLPLAVEPGGLVRIRMAFSGPVYSGNTVRADAHCSVPGDFTAGGPFDTEQAAGCPPVPALAAVEALAADGAGALVCFGDSITQMGMWTEPLAAALGRMRPGAVSVINKGIGGNRLLHGPASPSVSNYGRAGAERFARDVLEEAGAAAVILAIGTNDFGHVADPGHPEWVSAQMLAAAFVDLARQAGERGLTVYGATVPPCMGCAGFGPAQEAERSAFNRWVRQQDGGVFDRVIDFDEVLRDPARPDWLEMSWDSGDHLHPGSLGGVRMAEEVLKKLL